MLGWARGVRAMNGQPISAAASLSDPMRANTTALITASPDSRAPVQHSVRHNGEAGCVNLCRGTLSRGQIRTQKPRPPNQTG
jgi:hypothetical protein